MKTALGLLLFATAANAQFTSPIATGVRLDPAGSAAELGSMPIGMAVAPVNDQEFNAVLWLMLKGDEAPPAAVQRPVVHLLQLTH